MEGYFGVIIEEDAFWQGFYLKEENRQLGIDFVNRVRKNLPGVAEYIGDWSPQSDHMSLSDKMLLGALSGSLCESVTRIPGYPHNISGIPWGVVELSEGMRYLSQRDYFRVDGMRRAGGWRTAIDLIGVTNPDDARSAINRSQPVRRIKENLMSGKASVVMDFLKRRNH